MEQVMQSTLGDEVLGFQRCHGCQLVYPLESLSPTVGGYSLCACCLESRTRFFTAVRNNKPKGSVMKQKNLVTYVRCGKCGLLVDENFASVGAKKAVCDACSSVGEGRKAAREHMLEAGAFAAESLPAVSRL